MGTQSMVAQEDIIVRQEEYAVTIVITTIITWTLKTKGDMTKTLMHRADQTKAHI